LFDDRYRFGKQERVLDYLVHRVGDGARLRDVTGRSTSGAWPLRRR
jgi:hypothetical protein